MRKQELEELQRLEEELMASEYFDDDPIDEIDLLEDTWQDFADLPADICNTDTAPDILNVEICPDNKSSALPVVLIILLSCVVAFCAMKILGVL